MQIFSNYSLERLEEEEGYKAIGIPGLVVGPSIHVIDIEQDMRDSIKVANGDMEYDAMSLYFKCSPKRYENEVTEEKREVLKKRAFVLERQGRSHKLRNDTNEIPGFVVVQALKKVD